MLYAAITAYAVVSSVSLHKDRSKLQQKLTMAKSEVKQILAKKNLFQLFFFFPSAFLKNAHHFSF